MNRRPYAPEPIDTSAIVLSPELDRLVEQLAGHIHAVWARQRMTEGWTFGDKRNDEMKQHPCLVPFELLPEEEKAYDTLIARETVKAILALGLVIEERTDRST